MTGTSTDRSHGATVEAIGHSPEVAEEAIAWLEAEFPGWRITIDRTATWEGELRPLWIARSPGHHPQAELTAAKLHSRLSDYLDREERREAMRN